jgi:hypothetical protein
MLRGPLLPWLRSQGVDPQATTFALGPTPRPDQIPVEVWALIAAALFDARAAASASAPPA